MKGILQRHRSIHVGEASHSVHTSTSGAGVGSITSACLGSWAAEKKDRGLSNFRGSFCDQSWKLRVTSHQVQEKLKCSCHFP